MGEGRVGFPKIKITTNHESMIATTYNLTLGGFLIKTTQSDLIGT